jgi:hypothetical protein
MKRVRKFFLNCSISAENLLREVKAGNIPKPPLFSCGNVD